MKRTISALLALVMTLGLVGISPPARAAVTDADGVLGGGSSTSTWVSHAISPAVGATADGGKAIIEFDIVPHVESNAKGMIVLTNATQVATSVFDNFHIILRVGDGATVIDAANGDNSGGATNWSGAVGTGTSAAPYTVGHKYHVKIEADITAKKYDAWVTDVDSAGSDVTRIANGFGFRASSGISDGIAKLYLGAGGSAGSGSYTVSNFTAETVPPTKVTIGSISDITNLAAGSTSVVDVVTAPVADSIAVTVDDTDVATAEYNATTQKLTVTGVAAGNTTVRLVASASGYTNSDEASVQVEVTLPRPPVDDTLTLNYQSTDAETGQTGDLWIGGIGDRVFEAITYSKGTGDRLANLTLNTATGAIRVEGEGYTLAATGRPNQAVTFGVNATYYDADDVLFVENFEGADLGDKGIDNGGGQQFSGTYASGGAAYEMPIVADPTKARAGSKSITQGPVAGQEDFVENTKAEGIKAPLSDAAKAYLADNDGVVTMWYYDDSSSHSAQTGFGGGVYPSGWTTSTFSNMLGIYYQSQTTSGGYTNYSIRHASAYGGGTNWTGNTWASGPDRSTGWHKFQWKVGAGGTTFWLDGVQIGAITSASLKRGNIGGIFIPFNWNNISVPFNNRHFIDSFSVLKAGATASETFAETVTVYVVHEDDKLKFSYLQADDKNGSLVLTNEIGAQNLDVTFSTADNIASKLMLDPITGAVTAEDGYLLTDADNPVAVAVVFEVNATYDFGSGTEQETFHDAVTVYYDVDETGMEPDELTGSGARQVIDLNANWSFGGKNEPDASAAGFDTTGWQVVNVPHDWNAVSGSGGGSHDDGTYWYRKTLTLTQAEANAYNQRSAFLEFDAVGMESRVFLNGVEVGSHKGGWSAFKIDITGKLQEGDNVIAVSANNERKLNGDVSPLWGDFNNASGINRDVRLVLTSQVHIDQLDHGSHGVYMIPRRTNAWDGTADKSWEVDVTARIANDTNFSRDVTVQVTVKHPTSFDDVLGLEGKGLLRFDPDDMFDSAGTVVGTATDTLSAKRQVATTAKLTVPVNNPNLWNGISSPYQYVALIEVYEGGDTTGTLLDSYETMIGFRYYDAVRTDAYGYGNPLNGDGFYLNGAFYPLRGMAIHKDWPGLGRALEDKYIEKDIEVLYEMGANWTRVSHYPHDEYTYELLARYGIACSAEIPLVDGVSMVNHDGSDTSSKQNGKLSPGFKETTLDQLRDMVKQNYNTPSILGWLLQNELGGGTYGQGSGTDAKAAQAEMITALNDLAHELDPGRKTVMAMSLPHCYDYDADWLLWNNYPGWYGYTTTGIGNYIDNPSYVAKTPIRPIGASEYGAGVNPYHQIDYIRGVTPSSTVNTWSGTGNFFHPESYGNDRHEVSLREINARPFYWATAGWIMYDFAAASRNEGGRKGINDKGLVRKERPTDVADYDGDPENLLLRKDVFYLYKANWNPDPMTYIAESRYDPRPNAEITVTVYSNAPVVELWHNGTKIGALQATETVAYVNRDTIDNETGSCIFKFPVTLVEGGNVVEARGFESGGTTPHSDAAVVWQYGNPPELDIASGMFEINNTTKTIMLTGSGDAENLDLLFAPTDESVTHTYKLLNANQQPVASGSIKAGMLLEVTWGDAKRLYAFQQPYISALKPVLLDGKVSAEAANAVDFKEATRWEAMDSEAHTLTVDLGERYVLTELKVTWANEGSASAYTVETSNDGIVWNLVADRTANVLVNGIAQNELQSYGRYVRLSIAAGTSPKISELEVYGWTVSLASGETRIFVDETERTICVPTDIPDFHSGGNINAGMDFSTLAHLIVVEGNASAAHVNYDYSLDFNTSRFVVTDTLGREIPFVFQAFTGTTKPAGPFELAMGKPATSSSVQSSAYPAIHATTEDDTRWNGFSNGKTGLDEWVMVDLGAVSKLDSIRLEFPRNGVGGVTSNRYYTYEVYIGNHADGPFTRIIDQSGNTDMNGIFEFTTEVRNLTARFVRVKVTGNSVGYQPGLNRLYVKGWSIPEASYAADLTVNLDGAAYAGHGKTFVLRQSGSEVATGTGAGGSVSFGNLYAGVYDLYVGDEDTGKTLTIHNAPGSVTLDYYTVTFHSAGTSVGTEIVRSGNLAAAPADPTNGTGRFAGWYKDDVSFENEWSFDSDTVTETVTLYAEWSTDPAIEVEGDLADLKVGQPVSETVSFTLFNATYAASITEDDFKATNLPAWLTETVERTSDTVVTVTLSGTPMTYTAAGGTLTYGAIPQANIAGISADITPITSVTFSAVAKGDGAAVSAAPSVSGVPTVNSIEVGPVANATDNGQTVEYAIAAANTPVPATGWQAETTFGELTPATTYYVFARTASNENYEAGAAQVSAAIQTGTTALSIESVAAFSTKVVSYGTAESSLGLPGAVTVTLDDASEMELDVNWDTSAYNGDRAGTYTLTGALVLVEGVLNPDGLTATIDVRVQSQTVLPSNPKPVEPEPTIEVMPEVTVDAETGAASANVSKKELDAALKAALQSEAAAIVIQPEVPEGTTDVSVTLPGAAASAVGQEQKAITVDTPAVQVTIGSEGLNELARGTETIAVETRAGADGSIVIALKSDGIPVAQVSGGMEVTVPMPEGTDTTVIVLVNEDGSETVLPKSLADEGGITAPLDGSATIKIIDNAKQFDDVSADSWMTAAIAFVAARELLNGTDKEIFSPEVNMTRGMLATVLHRLELCPDGAEANQFPDLNPDAWYADAAGWAYEAGIIQGGSGNLLVGDEPITRAQLVTMLYRYAGYLGMDAQTDEVDMDRFADADTVPSWSSDAFAWAIANGIITGTDTGNLIPDQNATRAQVAAVLMRMIRLIGA